MNVINIQDLNETANIKSVGDTAIFLNLFFKEAVEELLEVFTDFSDFDIIAELVNQLHLDITAVIEPIKEGVLIYGYIFNKGGVFAWLGLTGMTTKKQFKVLKNHHYGH